MVSPFTAPSLSRCGRERQGGVLLAGRAQAWGGRPGRPAARGGGGRGGSAPAATGRVPRASLAAMVGVGWSHAGTDRLIDGVAIIGAVAFARMARATRRRAFGGPRDSVWSAIRPAPAPVGSIPGCSASSTGDILDRNS